MLYWVVKPQRAAWHVVSKPAHQEEEQNTSYTQMMNAFMHEPRPEVSNYPLFLVGESMGVWPSSCSTADEFFSGDCQPGS